MEIANEVNKTEHLQHNWTRLLVSLLARDVNSVVMELSRLDCLCANSLPDHKHYHQICRPLKFLCGDLSAYKPVILDIKAPSPSFNKESGIRISFAALNVA